MKLILQLIKTGLLHPIKLFYIYYSKKTHGNNICFLLKFGAMYYNNKPALTDGNDKLSFKEQYNAVLSLSAVISKEINPLEGSPAILICNNTIQHIITQYALQNLGLTVILVNSKLHQNEIISLINEQKENCNIFATKENFFPLPNIHSIETLVQSSKIAIRKMKVSKKYAPIIFPTSGTTGKAKLIEKKAGAFYWLRSFADLLTKTGIYKHESVFISVPISHGFGCTALLFALVLGKKAIIAGNIKQDAIARLVTREKAEVLAGVPASLFQLAKKLNHESHTVKLVISGGSALNENIFKDISYVFGKNIFSFYGSTEASTSFIADYKQLSQNVTSLGNTLAGIHYKLLKLAGGEKELLINSPLANIHSSTEWISTGDLVEKADDGSIYWCGRKDDMIIKKGVNIYPIEIEKAILSISLIEDVLVTGNNNTSMGEELIAFIQMKPKSIFNESEIRKQLRQKISGIKIPDKIIEIEKIDYSANGKKLNPLKNK